MSWSRFGSRSSRSRQDSWSGFAPYVSVADRRSQAAAQVNRMARLGHAVAPVVVEGSVITHTVWGKAWCQALESHADLANRLGRGRSYVRHGCVVDLQPSTGLVTALISGSELYHASITFEPLPPARWNAIVAACRGQIRSMVELLQGKLSTGVMAVVCRPAEGLFPRIGEMKMRCSCPDSAWMCKHLAAVLYGIGHRLDHRPEMLFTLRGVDPSELIAAAPLPALADDDPRSLGDADLSALFGVSLDDDASGPLSQLPPSSAAGAFAPIADLPPVSLVLPVAAKKPTKAASEAKKPTKAASEARKPVAKRPASTAKKPPGASGQAARGAPAPPDPPSRGKGGSTGEPLGDEGRAASNRPSASADSGRRTAGGGQRTPDADHRSRRRGRAPSRREAGSAPPLAAQGGERGGPRPSNPSPDLSNAAKKPAKKPSKAPAKKPSKAPAKKPSKSTAKKPAKR